MSEYKWVPQDNRGPFPDGNKWEYFKGKLKLARIVRMFPNEKTVIAGRECNPDGSPMNYFSSFKAAAKFIERSYK